MRRSIRNSHRIARHASQKGARSPVSGQAEDEKLATNLYSQPTLEVNPNEIFPQQGPSRQERPTINIVKKINRQKWTKEDYIEVMFCYYKAKADPNEGVTKDTYRIWRGKNPNDRPNLTDNALMNQRRYIERQNKLTEIKIEDIKRRIESEVNIQNSQTESAVADVLVEKTNSLREERNQDHIEPSQGEEIVKELRKLKKLRK